LLIKNKTLY